MIRYVSIFCVSVLLFSCATAPAPRTVTTGSAYSVARYSGSADDEAGAVREPNRAAAPAAGPQRLRNSALRAQVLTLEGDLEAKLATGDFVGALKDWDSIAALAGNTALADIGADSAERKLTDALRSIRFENPSPPAETIAGTAFKKEYSVTVTTEHAGARLSLANFPVTVRYPVLDSAGSRGTAAVELVSDAQGLVKFNAPVPAFAARDEVRFSANLSSADPSANRLLELSRNGGSLSASLPYLVSTNAKAYPSTISILDFDKNGRPVTSANVTATALLRPLVQKGFRPIGMADFQSQLASGDEAALYRAAKAQFGQAVRRMIYGTTKVDSLTKAEDGKWTCTLTAVISVYDFSTSTVICSTTVQHTVTAATEFAALDTARKEIGSVQLVNDLLYRM